GDGPDVPEWPLAEAGHGGREERVPSRFARGGHRGERAPVKSTVHGDDLRSAGAMASAPLARQLDRALVRLRAAIAEKHLVEPRRLGEQGREAPHGPVVIRGTAVDQPLALRHERVQHDARAMAETVDGPALDEVEIALAILIPEPRPGPFDHHGRRPVGDLHDVFELFDHGRFSLSWIASRLSTCRADAARL